MAGPKNRRPHLQQIAERLPRLIAMEAPPIIIANDIAMIVADAQAVYGDVLLVRLQEMTQSVREGHYPNKEHEKETDEMEREWDEMEREEIEGELDE